MSRAQRWLLPAGALTLLAGARSVPLPASWALPSTPVDAALLARTAPLPAEADLVPWRTPVVTCRLLVAALGRPLVVASSAPAAALEAHLTVGTDLVVGLVRREGVGLVELTTAPAEELAHELDRVLDVLGPGATAGEGLRVSRAAFAAGCAGAPGPLSDVLGRASRVLEATLVRPNGTLTGGLWYDADGWWRVEAVGPDVVVRPCAPRSRDWAPLLDQVLA